MQAYDSDDSYLRRAVLILLSLALFASLSATIIHWFTPVHQVMDLIVPPVSSLIFGAQLIALRRWPQQVRIIARIALLVAAIALVAPAWFYTLQAVLTPGEQLVTVLPPVSSLFVVLLVMGMLFIPGRRAWLAALLGWVLIALPVLAYLFAHPHELFTPRGKDLLMSYGPAAVLVVVLLPMQRGMTGTIQRMASERARMDIMLYRDVLTGIHNRRFGQNVLESCIGSDMPAGVIMMDLDRFKAINDTFGHPVGDKVLQTVAVRCRALLREDECLARWGGEEFLAVLPGIDALGLRLVSERLQVAIAQSPAGGTHRITASFGATMIRTSDTLASVLQRADHALYLAKAKGGNCVVMEPEAEKAPKPDPLAQK